jgi:hypothetical protein
MGAQLHTTGVYKEVLIWLTLHIDGFGQWQIYYG